MAQVSEPTLSISISRTDLSLSPLVLTGTPGDSGLGIVSYQAPAKQRRLTYAPSSPYLDGDTLIASVWQQSFLTLSVVSDNVSTENASKSALQTFEDAISQFSFTVTVTENGGTAQVWTCDPGSMSPAAGRTYVDLRDHNPVWLVTIPCQPIPG